MGGGVDGVRGGLSQGSEGGAVTGVTRGGRHSVLSWGLQVCNSCCV